MKRLGIAGAIAVLGMALSVPAFAQPRHHFYHGPRVVIGAGPFYGPYYSPWYGPYWGATYVPPAPTTGSLDIDTSKYTKHDLVYVDGGYAGVAKDVDHLPLNPGTHQVEVRTADGQTVYQQTVNISLGHKTKLDVG